MECQICTRDITDVGLLITTGGVEKQWACVYCFVEALIKDRATIIHHWGFPTEKAKEPHETDDATLIEKKE